MGKRIPPRYGRNKRPAAKNDLLSESASGEDGLIISNYGQALDVEDRSGNIHRCTPRKKIANLVCGDKVLWLPTNDDQGVIIALQPRQTLLARPDNNGNLKPIAANVDQLLVVIDPRSFTGPDHIKNGDPPLDTSLIDRYLVAAELSRIHAMIVINKTDLFNVADLERIRLFMEIYQDIGYNVLFTSCKKASGFDELNEALNGHISVFCGPSGAGKSSLVKTVFPDQDIRIGELSSSAGTGRHTTTLATLYRLSHGGALIDSPGVRDFGLWHVGTAQIAQGFLEFQQYATNCRFADCSHTGEPDCAVEQAVKIQQVSPVRFANYRRIVASLHH